MSCWTQAGFRHGTSVKPWVRWYLLTTGLRAGLFGVVISQDQQGMGLPEPLWLWVAMFTAVWSGTLLCSVWDRRWWSRSLAQSSLVVSAMATAGLAFTVAVNAPTLTSGIAISVVAAVSLCGKDLAVLAAEWIQYDVDSPKR